MDALQSDLKIINQCYQHLYKNKKSDDLSYIDAYKYAFSRTGDHNLIQISKTIVISFDLLVMSTKYLFSTSNPDAT